jgi:hypothetical protein
MGIQDLPSYIYHDIEMDDGTIKEYCFFLSINRDAYGKWSCGYVSFADDEHDEFAIPQLVTNNSDTITEAAVRMAAKIKRFNKLGEL